MTCAHLQALEKELLDQGFKETFRGQAWGQNCREWVYFACYLSLAEIRARVKLAPCVKDHLHRGTHDGQEAGLVCTEHWDALMGAHPDFAEGQPVFR